MTTTVEQADTMTVAEIVANCGKLRDVLGVKARVSVGVSPYHPIGNEASVGIDTPGNPYKCFLGSTWAEVFAKANEWAPGQALVRRNSIVRRMALAIIEITDEHGSCAEARLIGKEFCAEEIAEFHEAACVRAGEMAGNTPFSVVFGGVV